MATGLDWSGIQQFSPYEDPTTLSNRWTVWLNVSSASLLPWTLKIQLESVVCCSILLAPMLKRFSKLSRINGEEKDYVVGWPKIDQHVESLINNWLHRPIQLRRCVKRKCLQSHGVLFIWTYAAHPFRRKRARGY